MAAAVAAVNRARHAVTDMAYFAARDTSPAAVCGEMVAQSDVYVPNETDQAAATHILRWGSGAHAEPRCPRSVTNRSDIVFEVAAGRGERDVTIRHG